MKINEYENRRLKLIADEIKGNKILDIGYASIPNSYISDCYLTGYDLEFSKQKISNYNETIQGDVKLIKKKLKNRNFDTIICGELIEHLENPYHLLRDLHHLLKKDGRLIISTPNPFGFPVFIFELFRNKKYYYNKSHKYYFLPRWVNRLLEDTGYRICNLIPVGFWLPYKPIPVCPKSFSYQIIYISEKKDEIKISK